MHCENLPLTKKPFLREADKFLETTGLALEYFPSFIQPQHEFHTHDFIEIIFVFSGTFRHITAGRIEEDSAGKLTILNYHQYHSLKTTTESVELMNVYWNPSKHPLPELPNPLSTRLHELIPIHPIQQHRLNRIRHLQLSEPDKAAQLLRMLYKEQMEAPVGNKAAMESLFRLFLIELCRAAPKELEGSIRNINPRMESIRQHLEEHYTKPIRLEHLCKITGLKKSNLCRQFKTYTGLSTGDYLKQRRLAEAMKKLRTSSEKILSICYECGFPDISNFNRTFRAALNQSPSEYRKSSANYRTH